MTSPAAVGSAWVVLRATSDKVRDDIKKAMQNGWRDSEREALGAGRRAGQRYGRGFRAGLESQRLGRVVEDIFGGLERDAGLSGARAGRRYADSYNREASRAGRGVPSGGGGGATGGGGTTRAAPTRDFGGEVERANRRRDAEERSRQQQEARRQNAVQRMQSGVDRANQRRDAGEENTRRDRVVRIKTVLNDTATRVLRTALSAIMGMLKSIAVLSAAAMSVLAGQAAIAGLTGILGSLTQIAGVLLTLPALAVAFAAPLAAAVIGANGLSGAFQAMKQQAAGAAQTAKAVAAAQEQVTTAEESLQTALEGVGRAEKAAERAARDHERARENVGLAIKEVTERLQDLNLELKGTALDEEDALIGVARAEERLRNMPAGSTALDRREAINDLHKARLRVEEVREANEDLRQEANQANAEGVEGSRTVRDARQAEADAADGVAEAQKGIADAHKEVAKAQQALAKAIEGVSEAANSGGADKFAEAMAKLAPSAQAFVLAMRALGPEWTDLRKAVQENLFAGMGESVTELARAQLPVLKEGLSGIATVMNHVAKDVMGAFSAPDALEKWRIVLERIRVALDVARPGIVALVGAFKNLVTVGSEFLSRFAQGFTDNMKQFENWTSNFDHIRKLINEGIDAAKLFWALLTNLGGGLKAIFDAGADSGFTERLVALTGEFETFMKSTEGQDALGRFFSDGARALDVIGPILKEVTLLLLDVGAQLADFGVAISPGVLDFFRGLREGVENLRPAFDTIGPKVSELFSALGAVMPQLGSTVSALVEHFAPWIDMLTLLSTLLLPPLLRLLEWMAPVLAALSPVIVGLALAWKGVVVVMKLAELWSRRAALAALFHAAMAKAAMIATRLWGIAMAIFNAIVSANPLVRFALVLAAIGAALFALYKKNETFRKAVDGAWQWIKRTIGDAWEYVIKPALGRIGDKFRELGEIFMMVWNEWIKPAWDIFSSAVGLYWEHVIKPIFQYLVDGWKLAGTVFMWAWENLIKPAWEIFTSSISFYWNNVIKPVFNFVVDGWKLAAEFFMWAWEHRIKPAWNALTTALTWAWDNIIKPLFESFKEGVRLIGVAFTWAYENVIKPAWDGVGRIISWVWENVIKKAFESFKLGLETLKGWFDTIVKAIGTVWESLQETVKKPLRFMVDIVFNKGIRVAWNSVAGLIGADQLPEMKVEGLKTGGTVDARKLPFQDQTYGVMSGYAPGRDDRLIAVGGGEPVLRPEAGRVLGTGWVNGINSAARNGGVGGVRRWMRDAYADGGIVESMRRFAVTNVPGMQLTSGLRFTDSGYHSKGMAGDFSDTSANRTTPGMQRLSNLIANTFGPPKTLQLIHHPFNRNIGQQVGWVGDGMGFYGAGTMLEHQDHVHWAAGSPVDNIQGDDQSVFGSIVDGITGLVGRGAAALFDAALAPTDLAIKGLAKILGGNESPFGKMPQGFYDAVKSKLREFIVSKDGDGRSVLGAGVGMPSPGSGPVMDQVREAMLPYGWHEGAEWDALVQLVQGESSWNPTARNPSSGAYGLFQFLGSTKDAYLPDENPNPRIQGAAGARYIKDRYGSPTKAWAFWNAQSPHWYDNGGWLKKGLTMVRNDTGKPEPVLTNQQWDWVKQGLNIEGANKWAMEQDFGAQFQKIGVDALKETVGGFTELVGLRDPVEQLIDMAVQAATEAAQNQATYEPNKIADTMIFNGMDPQKVIEEQERAAAQSMTPSNGRYRGSN